MLITFQAQATFKLRHGAKNAKETRAAKDSSDLSRVAQHEEERNSDFTFVGWVVRNCSR